MKTCVAKPKILIIDDLIDPRNTLSYLLEFDYEIATADDVKSGLEIFNRITPDLVIMDIMLPDKSGIDGLREIREIDAKVSVIMLTGYACLETAQKAISLGANEYVQKPWNAEEILALVNKCVEDTRKKRNILDNVKKIFKFQTRANTTPSTVPYTSTSQSKTVGPGKVVTNEESAAIEKSTYDFESTKIQPDDQRYPDDAIDLDWDQELEKASSKKIQKESSEIKQDTTLSYSKGSLIPGYEMLELLGEGNMGLIYLVRNVKTSKKYALKVIKTYGRDNKAKKRLKERFFHEAEATAAIKHPNIIEIVEIQLNPDLKNSYIVMEFVEGEPLSVFIDECRVLKYTQKAEIITQIADALAAIHTHDIYHRDIKPSNIIVDRNLNIKLMDFGVAKLPSSMLTMTSDLLGTPGYMAPESFVSSQVDHRADLFSLGILTYEFFLGEHPFETDNYVQAYHLITTADHIPPSKIALDFPKDLEQIIEKMLKKDPEKRYNSAAEVAADLRIFVKSLSDESHPSLH